MRSETRGPQSRAKSRRDSGPAPPAPGDTVAPVSGVAAELRRAAVVRLGLLGAVGLVTIGTAACSAPPHAGQSSRTTVATCPVSNPGNAVAPLVARMNFGSELTTSRRGWVSGGSLWVQLPPRSQLGAIRTSPGGRLETKFGWFRSVPGQVRVTGRPVSGPAALFRSSVGTVPEYGPSGFTPSVLEFGRPGCWQITGVLGGSHLNIVMTVVQVSP